MTIELLPALSGERGVVAFHSTDSAELFQRNLVSQPQTWPWRHLSVEYRLNSEGYRAPAWPLCDFSSSVWLLGCSWAFGVGVSEDQTVAHCLSERLDRPVINVSQGGSSIRWSCDQFTVMLAQGLRPRAVAVIWTDVCRWPWYGSLGPDQARMSHELWLAHSQDQAYADRRSLLDVMALRQQCEFLRVPLMEASWNPHTCTVLSVSQLPDLDRARDLAHPGPQSHRAAAEILTELL